MRNIILAAILLSLSFCVIAQSNKTLQNVKVHTTLEEQRALGGKSFTNQSAQQTSQNGSQVMKQPGDTSLLGSTSYDLQTNNSVCRRIIDHGNDRLSATWIYSTSFNVSSQDRGTGYNFYDGNSWQAPPQSRIENIRVGWPNVGSTGDREYVITHANNIDGMNFAFRNQIGSGSWQFKIIPNDAEATWPRAANMGDTIFVIASRFSGQGSAAPIFNGVEGGIALHRSWDGGDSWMGPDPIDGLNGNNFAQIGGDTYAIDANEKSGVVAVVTGFPVPTLFKSTDYGDTWDMTRLIDVPNPLYTGATGETIDSTVTSDESYSIIVDDNGKAHVFYGRQVIVDDDPNQEGWQFFPFNAGIMYWSEYMGTDKEPKRIWETAPAAENLQLCEFVLPQGINQQDWANAYFQNIVSMPQAGTDANGNIYLSYTGMRSGIFDQQGSPVNLSPQGLLYSNTFAIKSTNQGQDWMGPVNVSQDSTEEAVYPSIPRHVKGDSLPVLYQTDAFPGTAVQDQQPGNNGNSFVLNNQVVTNIHTNNFTAPPDITCPTIDTSLESPVATGDTATSFLNCPIDLSFLNVTDVPEGDITDKVQFVNPIDSSQLGYQTGTVFVEDNAGNSSDTVEIAIEIVQDGIPPTVSLNGFDTVAIILNSSYTDAGATPTDNSSCAISLDDTTNLDTSTTGTYFYTYVATDGSGNSDTVTRTINVIAQDNQAPSISLNGGDTVTTEACGNFNDPGATAFDNVQLDVTDSIQVSGSININQPGNYTLTYSVTDSSGNTGTATRVVKVVDTTPPEMELTGSDEIYVCLGANSFNDPGATANDCVDGSFSESEVNSNANNVVDLNSRGQYNVEYTVTDNAGNQGGPVTRKVIVNTEPDAKFDFSKNGLTVNFTDTSLYNPTQWTWTWGHGGLQNNNQNPSHTFPSAGTYQVCLQASNQFNADSLCDEPADSVCKSIEVTKATGITKASIESSINIYPNPTKGQVNIELADDVGDQVSVKVYDIVGKTYIRGEYDAAQAQSNITMDISDLNEGLYFISIQTDKGTVTKKVTLSD